MKLILIPLASLALISVSCSKQEEGSASAAPSESASKTHPLEVCIVSGEKLGSMGEPFVFVHEGREIKLCCKSCKKKFDKDPAAYLKKLDERK